MSNSFNVAVAKFSHIFSWCLQVTCLTLLIVICDLCQHISFLFIMVCDLCQHRHCPCLSIEKKLLFVICANTFHFCLLWFVICASADNIFCPCLSIEKIVICDLCQHISFLFIVICSWCRSEFIMQAASWGSYASFARTSKRRWGTAAIMWWFGCFCFGSQFCYSESLSLLNM